uniref:TetR/AcrR family transcriptional regulator n=1 Tax=Candidatus Fimivicinus sp. TaxID=3056640 RepID=UPI003FEE66B6
MYHYFTSKDDLFLTCARDFFQMMNDWLSDNFSDGSNLPPIQKIQAYFMCCIEYFQTYFEGFEIYKTFAICPPGHLKKDIVELHRPLADRNYVILKNIISEMNLRDSVPLDVAITYVSGVSWSYLIKLFQERDSEMSGNELEKAIREITDMIFFGIKAKAE